MFNYCVQVKAEITISVQEQNNHYENPEITKSREFHTSVKLQEPP